MHDNHPATLFVALDLSRSSWVAAVHAPHAAGKVSRHKLAPGAEGLLALIERIRAQAERALGAPARVASCHEAGRDGFWLQTSAPRTAARTRSSSRRSAAIASIGPPVPGVVGSRPDRDAT